MQERHARALTPEELSISADEERLLAAVRAAVREGRQRAPARAARLDALASLREAYAVAGEGTGRRFWPQLHEEAARDEASAGAALPDLDEPYLGHLRVRSGRSRDVLLGERALLDPARGVTLVDWRRAPIAEVFFTCEPGDDYEIEVEGRVVEGSWSGGT